MDRRDFLRLAAGAAVTAAVGGGCTSGAETQKTTATRVAAGKRTLRIAQWGHFVPTYDIWFDNEFAREWGEERDVEVLIDHIPVNELVARGDAEAAARRGHDLFAFATPRPALEDLVIDHREIVDEVAAKVGPLHPFVERSVRNPKTGRYFGFSDFWTPAPSHYRMSLWDSLERGLRPNTWDAVLLAAGRLKTLGHPIGLGYAAEHDSGWTLAALMQAFGASIQDEDARLRVNTSATVEAVKFGVALFRQGMEEDVFNWDGASNNRLLATGEGSLIINPISALRATEKQDPALAADIGLAPPPIGPAGDVPRDQRFVNCYVIWRFAEQPDLARQFLVDLASAARESFIHSEFDGLPSFPGSVPDLSSLVASDPRARPADKYGLLAHAASWMTNIGAPGSLNAAVDETFNRFVVPRMFAAAARGEKTPEQAVADAEAEMRPIFDKWRERGKI